MAGYHKRDIPKGVLGEESKISEEYLEFVDAFEQNNPIMQLVELSDLIGAIEEFAYGRFRVTLADLITMKNATREAFRSGHRKNERNSVTPKEPETFALLAAQEFGNIGLKSDKYLSDLS